MLGNFILGFVAGVFVTTIFFVFVAPPDEAARLAGPWRAVAPGPDGSILSSCLDGSGRGDCWVTVSKTPMDGAFKRSDGYWVLIEPASVYQRSHTVQLDQKQ